ncbi:AAA family ATPase [Corynebacterium bovis]|uniref:AAA family ATPase n=1 Tax=Corynebacterium bovis TaxID=36808 RepID=UPI00313A2AE7
MLRIHSLTLDHVAGVRHADLTVPDHGVTVVHGPNERGKSTLLKAFQLLLSDYKSTSSAAKVRALKSNFADEPTTVAASLTVGPHRLEITKSFNKGTGTCILTVHTPRPERVTGAEAVGRFSEILRSEIDADLLAALTVEQGDTPGVLAVAGIGALDRALAGAGDADGDATGAEDGADGTGTGAPADATGAEAGGAADRLIAAIDAEYGRYYTAKTGKPTGELRAAVEALDEATGRLDGCRREYEDAQALITEVDRLTAARSAVHRRIPDAEAEAEQARRDHAAARRARDLVERARDALGRARADVTLAETQRDRRAADVAALDREREALAAAEAEVTGLATAAQEERRRLGTIDATRELVRRRRRLAQAAVGAVEAAVEARSAAATRDERRRQLAEGTAAEDRTRAAEQVVAENPATAEGLAAIRQADQDLVLAGKLRDAAATAVTVTGPAGGEAVVDGEPRSLDGGVDLRAVQETTIGLGEYEVVVTPARDVRDAQAEVDDARQARDRLLAAWGVGDVAEAEQLARRRVTAGEAVTEARIAFSRVTGGRPLGELREEVDALTRRAEEAYQRWRTSALALVEDVGDHPAGDGGSGDAPGTGAGPGEPSDAAGGAGTDAGADVPDPADCARRLVADWDLTPSGDDAPGDDDTPADQRTGGGDDTPADPETGDQGSAERSTADQHTADQHTADHAVPDAGGPDDLETLRAVDVALESLAETLHDERDRVARGAVAVRWETRRAECERQSGRIARMEEELRQAREERSDAALDEAVDAARRAVEERTAVLDEHRRDLGDRDVDVLARLAAGAVDRVTHVRQEDVRLREQLSHATGALGRSGGAAERFRAAEAEHARAARTAEAVTARAAAAELLHRETHAARREARERHAAPFTRAFDRLASVVFGRGVHFEFSAELAVVRRVAGGEVLDTGQLSGGAQEQLALLSRLAVATLVGAGGSVPIIIDDALGNTDPERLKLMNAVLGMLGDEHQVIVLTCDPGRFDRIGGGARLIAMDELLATPADGEDPGAQDA